MATYHVIIKEIHTASVSVEAESAADARSKVSDMILDDNIDTQYDYTTPPEEWTVHKMVDKPKE